MTTPDHAENLREIAELINWYPAKQAAVLAAADEIDRQGKALTKTERTNTVLVDQQTARIIEANKERDAGVARLTLAHKQMTELQLWCQELRIKGEKISADALWSKLNALTWTTKSANIRALKGKP